MTTKSKRSGCNLDNHSRDMSNLVNVIQDKRIGGKETLVLKIMIFNACKGLRPIPQHRTRWGMLH